MNSIICRFQDSAVPRSPRNMPTLEAENFSYCLKPSQSTPTLVGVKTASLEAFRASALDCLTGSAKPQALLEFDPTWAEILDSNGQSTSMYGHHLLYKTRNGFSQLDKMVRKLVLDNDTRQACFIILKPEHLLHDNLPCTYGMNFRIRDNQLNCSVHMRSQDLIGSMCSDIAFAKLVQRLLVSALTVEGLTVGSLAFAVDSAHVYEKDFDILQAPNFQDVLLEDIIPQSKITSFLT